MPRLVGYTEKVDHDFGMVVNLTHDRAEDLLSGSTIPPSKLLGTGLVQCGNGLMPDAGAWIIRDIAIDRSDVEVEFQIGARVGYRYCGPWMRGHRMDLLSILLDVVQEGRSTKDVVEAVRSELEQSKGMRYALIVPVRVGCYAWARLLPNAPEGWATIHFRTTVKRDIQ